MTYPRCRATSATSSRALRSTAALTDTIFIGASPAKRRAIYRPTDRSRWRSARARGVRGLEPRMAPGGGFDGLFFYRRIAGEAARYLSADGSIAVEIGAGMSAEVARLFADAGFADVRVA